MKTNSLAATWMTDLFKCNSALSHYCVLLAVVFCAGCVPINNQIAESDNAEIDGFVGPLIIDSDRFYQTASWSVYDTSEDIDKHAAITSGNAYMGTFDGREAYILNCKCLRGIKIVNNHLSVVHSYGGGESNRERTMLLWNGEYYQNSNGEKVVDLILYTDQFDPRRAMLQEKKILDVSALRVNDASFVWINLLGYEGLIKYTYR